ncbi:hypothetical protein B0H13DRAFT_1900457 [Mycena leptocephala]|nr:hypothetical protein B0H13DRAFT_1900457 [Mycena leptocephala]
MLFHFTTASTQVALADWSNISRLAVKVACPVCKGRGTVQDWVKCGRCGGGGKRRVRNIADDGSESDSDGFDSDASCNDCYNGEVPAGDKDCPFCGGGGGGSESSGSSGKGSGSGAQASSGRESGSDREGSGSAGGKGSDSGSGGGGGSGSDGEGSGSAGGTGSDSGSGGEGGSGSDGEGSGST